MEENLEKEVKKVLVVDDEQSIREVLVYNLKKEGYETLEAGDGITAVNIALEQKPDLMLLDIMLPKLDGLSVCKRVKNHLNIPILMLTAKDAEIDKIVGLELGADDYITKPFEIEELFARIRVILRRLKKTQEQNAAPTSTFTFGPLKIDLVKHEFYCNDEKIYLTPKEFALMTELMQDPEKVKSRDELLDVVWGYDFVGQTNTVDVYIRTIRNKLGEPYKKLIKTVRGLGYCLREDD